MRLLPYERLTLRTESPPDVVEAKLTALVSTKSFSLGATPEPFRGQIEGRHFKISPVPGWLNRNSFRPVVVGDVVPVPGGTEVRISMRLNAFVLAFMVFWLGGVLSSGVIALLTWLFHSAGAEGAQGQLSGMALAFPLGMALFAYGLVSVGFWPEAKKARRLLRERLGCREEDAPNRLVRS